MARKTAKQTHNKQITDKKAQPAFYELVHRKLALTQKSLNTEIFQQIQGAYDGLQKAVQSAVGSKKTTRDLSLELQKSYRQLVSIANNATKKIPESVGATIRDLLNQTQVSIDDSAALHGLANKFSWSPGEEPSTLTIIDVRRFKDLVKRETSRYGMDQEVISSTLNPGLGHAAALAHVEILNLARTARERLAVDLEVDVLKSNNQQPEGNSIQSPHDPIATQSPFAEYHQAENLTFKDIKIRVDVDNHILRISVTGRSDIKMVITSFREMGLMRKNSKAPNAQGQLLEDIARKMYVSRDSKAYRTALIRLSKALRNNLGLTDPPFLNGNPQFKISVPKDIEAAQKGRRRSVSYDDSRSVGTIATVDWLKTKDPNFDPSDPIYSEDD